MRIDERGHAQAARGTPGAFQSLLPAGVIAVEWRGDTEPETLSEVEIESLGRAAPQRRREFAAGRQCARRALERCGVADAVIGRGADRRPLWPAPFVGSIAHTADFAAAAVAHREAFASLGIDVERREAVGEHLWRRIAVPAELDWIGGLPEAERVPAATLLFSAKEAIYKCVYPWLGLRLGFQDVALEVRLDGEDLGSLTVRGCGEAPPLPPFDARFRWEGAYVLTAVAVPADAAPCERSSNEFADELVQGAGGGR